MRFGTRQVLPLLAALLVAAVAGTASAQSTIKTRGARPSYGVEFEPHFLAAPFSPPGIGTGDGVGVGIRGTFEILGEGFISRINDSVGIGVGLDWVHYDGIDVVSGRCVRYEDGPNGTQVCVELAGGAGGDTDYLWIPVVMQWNFWLHRNWSVFGEPGLALRLDDMDSVRISPVVLYLGGRFHFTDHVALTMRLGYPTFSIGASFLF